jgi:A118 family predicted phage portal protein
MFEGIKNFFRTVVRKMFPVEKLQKVIGEEFALSDIMIKRIELWSAMNGGSAPWVDDYVKSLRLEKGICREFANVCLNEMETSISNKKLDEIYKEAIRDLNENLQSGLALGSFIIKPLGQNKVEYVTADRFIPVEFDSRGRLINVVFLEVKRIKEDSYYFRFEQHKLDEAGLTITNRAFHSTDNTSIGREVPLNSVDEWARLPESVTYPGVIKPDFGYYRNPIKNDIDGSFCGVSIFDGAIDQIKKADKQYGHLDWEFESGERAVHVDMAALQAQPTVSTGGKTRFTLPKLNKRLYRGLNLSAGNNEELYKEYSPDFRDENIINGLNAYLRRIEFNVSLSYGDLSDVQYVEKTAQEIKTTKKRKYNMVTAIQKNLKDCLEDLVYALAFYNALTKSGYEFICNFKDSILVDEETERQQDRQDVAMGVMPLWEYRMKWYGEDEETAKSKIPDQADIIP